MGVPDLISVENDICIPIVVFKIADTGWVSALNHTHFFLSIYPKNDATL
jgi:hypothetical protein